RLHGPREGELADDAPSAEAGRRVMTRTLDRMLWPSLWMATLLFLVWGVVPGASVFATTLSPTRLVALACLVKMGLLALGVAWSWQARRALDTSNPVRPAWTLL